MKFICIAAMALSFYSCHRKTAAQTVTINKQQTFTDPRGNAMLLGVHQKEDLQQQPYNSWFDKNYADYKIDSATADQLKPYVKDKHFEIFMGTWCGDSKREVPRMFKLLEYGGVQPSQIKMIMVYSSDTAYKQSPTHEEKGKSILRVPDLIVYKNNKEINRIVESPVVSLEKDLLSITKENSYQPNYKGGTYLSNLANKKTVSDIMKDSTHLIEQLKALVNNSAEINTLGYVWMSAGENDKAMMAFQLNASLFPDDANVYDSLGELNLKLNNKDLAKKYYQRVIEMQPTNANAKKMLEKASSK